MKQVELPEIGDTITLEWWIELAEYFGLDSVAKKLREHPERYRPWVFDGCSGLPQRAFKILCGDKYDIVTKFCCCPHDLSHAAGGTEEERAKSNEDFRENLIDLAKFSEAKAYGFYYSVVVGGSDKFDTEWKWGFALKE